LRYAAKILLRDHQTKEEQRNKQNKMVADVIQKSKLQSKSVSTFVGHKTAAWKRCQCLGWI